MTRSRAIVLTAVIATLAGVGVAVFLLPHLLSSRIDREAKARGFLCTYASNAPGSDAPTSLVLRDLACTLDGVRGVTIHAAKLTVATKDMKPISAFADGLAIEARGDTVPGDLARWNKTYGGAQDLGISAEDAKLDWHLDASTLVVGGRGKLVIGKEQGGSLKGSFKSFVSDEAPLGSIAWKNKGETTWVDVAFDREASKNVKSFLLDDYGIRATLVAKEPATAQIDLAGGKWPSLVLKATLPSDAKGPIEGTLDYDGVGQPLAMPREVRSLFRGYPKATARFTFASDRKRIDLSDVVVDIGGRTMRGVGDVIGGARGPRLEMKLNGSLKCSEVGASAAQADLGAFGKLFGGVAKRTLTGDIAVTVTIGADLVDLSSAKVDSAATPACHALGL